VRRPIEDDEQVLRNKCKFGHRRGQTRKPSFAESKTDDVQVQLEVRFLVLNGVLCLSAPMLTVRPPAINGQKKVISACLNSFCIDFVL